MGGESGGRQAAPVRTAGGLVRGRTRCQTPSWCSTEPHRGHGNQKLLTAAALVSLLMTAMGAQQGWAHSDKAAIALKTYTGIVVDGKLDDWVRRLERSNWTAQLEVKKGHVLEWVRAVPIHINTLTARVESGTVTSPEDFSAVVYTLWDERYLYVAASVTDDQLVTEQVGEDIWQDDALELWLDCRHDAVTHTMFQDDEYQLGFSPAGRNRSQALAWTWRNPTPEPVRKALRVASSATSGGYLLEAAVPWQVLVGCQPGFGQMIGFNISLADKDADQLWTHITWSGTLHSDPTQFGHLYFLDAPIDLLPSDVLEGSQESAPWEPLLESSR